LVQHRTEVFSKLTRALEEPQDWFLRIAQALHVGQETAGLDREQEAFRRARTPGLERRRLRQPVERVLPTDAAGASAVS
jgi:hypothetical protein